MKYEEVADEKTSKLKLKNHIKKKAIEGAFVELFQKLQRSSKVKNIKYNKLEIQEYLKSKMSKEERTTITALRSRCLREIKTNFSNMYKGCQHCPLKCNEESPELDTQEHILQCTVLGGSIADSDFVYAGAVDQRLLGREVSRLMGKRAQLLEASTSSDCGCLPGALPDQRPALLGGAPALHLHV